MDYTHLQAQAYQSLAQCQYLDARSLYEQCIDIQPQEPTNYWYLGLSLLLLEQIEEAEATWFSLLFQDELEQLEIGSQKLIQLLTQEAAFYHQKGYLIAAEKIYSYVLQQDPSAQAHHNLGTVLADRGQINFAIQLYQKAIELDSSLLESYVNLGCCLIDRGNFIDAYNCLYHALLKEPDNLVYRKWFAMALSHLTFNIPFPEVIQELQKCFAQKEIYKLNLIAPTISIIKLDDDFKTVLNWVREGHYNLIRDYYELGKLVLISENILFQELLEKTVIHDLDLEAFLTLLRKTILGDFKVQNKIILEKCSLDFLCSLAQQCFNNEYIYDLSLEEIQDLKLIQVELEQLIDESQASLSDDSLENLEIHLAIYSLYHPVSKLKNSEKLSHLDLSNFSTSIRSLITRTLLHYWQEQDIKRSLISLTSIENTISLAVQNQYEENPYPRWLGITALPAKPITAILGRTIPYFQVPEKFINRTLKVLVAGCGTGGEAVFFATRYKNTEVLAIDISLSSLAYAIRMSRELELENITFQQADILALGSLNCQFDLISSTGVLHHLENPYQGMKNLVDLLVPSGLIKIGLYSKKARQAIQRAREYIQATEETISLESIKKIRRQILLLARQDVDWAKQIVSLSDFSNLSNCRDLLFHVCEHCFTLPEIAAIFQDLNLEFLGFYNLQPSIKDAYQKMFPEDLKMNDLNLWDKFEAEYPNTFISMYNCWGQKQD